MKKGVGLVVLSGVFSILIVSFASAGFFSDLFPRLGPADTTDVGVTVNSAPTIVSISAVGPVTLSAGTFTAVSFQFVAEDLNGALDLDDLTATASFSRAGEVTRDDADGVNDGVDGCTFNSELGNQRTYDCIVSMMYYDDDGSVVGLDPWTVTVSIDDSFGETGQGTDDFNVNLLREIALSPGIISFPPVAAGLGPYNAVADTVLTNNGNFDADGLGGGDGPVMITALDLAGEVFGAETIPASDFAASDEAADPCAPGTMLGPVSQPVIDIDLPRGDGTGGNNQGSIDFCLVSVPALISSQTYSASLSNPNSAGPWTIAI